MVLLRDSKTIDKIYIVKNSIVHLLYEDFEKGLPE